MFAWFGSKMAITDYYQGFYFSQSKSYIIGNNIIPAFQID